MVIRKKWYMPSSSSYGKRTELVTSSLLLTLGAEKVVGDVGGVVDADPDAYDEHRGGDRVNGDV